MWAGVATETACRTGAWASKASLTAWCNRRKQSVRVSESDLPLGRVRINVHLVGRDHYVDYGNGIPAVWQHPLVRLCDGIGDGPIKYPTVVNQQSYVGPVAATDLRCAYESVNGNVAVHVQHGQHL